MTSKISGRLIVRSLRVFQDANRAEIWLNASNALLQGRTPLEALRTPEGAAQVERQLNWYSGRRERQAAEALHQ